MKNPRTSEEMLDIANKCALAEEATLDNKDSNRDPKKDKEMGQSNQPSTSNIERSRCNKIEYRPRP
jgi:hypothetical protein